ncbi:MAG TPA: biotin/lipoyl-binding protein, partial [Gemmataceae bacterium]|nr:biotin/lipoyl-binding protein [Gemmataceae bacterium]
MKKIIIAILLLAAAGGFGGWYLYSADKQGTSFRTVRVERGDLLATIGATGTIEPEEVIDVGAQVAGQIVSFGQDPRGNGKLIDYGSPVEKDTVLARIDESLYRAQLDRAKAQVAQAAANVQRAEADLGQMRA